MSGDKRHKSPAGVDNSAHKNIQRKEDSGFDLSAVSEANGRPYLSTMKIKNRKRKSLVAKDPSEEEKKSISKIKRIGQIATVQKQAKSLKPPERSSSNTNSLRLGTSSAVSNVQVSSANQVSLPTRLRSRRKKALMRFELKSPENIGNDRPNNFSQSLHNRALDLKEKLSRCLSSQILHRWCAFEWFYNDIDYPWFAKREFVEYLNHVGLGHIPRLTRVEWGVIRSSLGKPRRFLHEEKEKLEQYRESVRTHYTDLCSSKRDGLPADLAQPPIVGNRVIAWHPKKRELHDGKVLTVYCNKCLVQFDRPELGSELVMVICSLFIIIGCIAFWTWSICSLST
ncbi:hypothetical protein IFM89_034632 [Coptis chinensis]|uniref:DIRP domain-containing protein n=1 Tax=Coptis chinensis TaxID=261450 RepID=A0A835HYY2_9MAGN|nr:hypothetical protein IFM89_034632 [Coptis chinensis]